MANISKVLISCNIFDPVYRIAMDDSIVNVRRPPIRNQRRDFETLQLFAKDDTVWSICGPINSDGHAQIKRDQVTFAYGQPYKQNTEWLAHGTFFQWTIGNLIVSANYVTKINRWFRATTNLILVRDKRHFRLATFERSKCATYQGVVRNHNAELCTEVLVCMYLASLCDFSVISSG